MLVIFVVVCFHWQLFLSCSCRCLHVGPHYFMLSEITYENNYIFMKLFYFVLPKTLVTRNFICFKLNYFNRNNIYGIRKKSF